MGVDRVAEHLVRIPPKGTVIMLSFLAASAASQSQTCSDKGCVAEILTGKGLEWGGSLIRPEATGYGLVYFTREMLKTKGTDFKGKNVVLSGSGNVATYACEKVIDLGGKRITMSDSSGYITDMDGIDREKLAYII